MNNGLSFDLSLYSSKHNAQNIEKWLAKTTFRAKIGWFWVRETPDKKINGSLLISATVEASDFKFGTQLRFVEQFSKNNYWD